VSVVLVLSVSVAVASCTVAVVDAVVVTVVVVTFDVVVTVVVVNCHCAALSRLDRGLFSPPCFSAVPCGALLSECMGLHALHIKV
jgi:hypothetical protein